MLNDRQPLYMQIQDYFKDQIKNGQLQTGDKIPAEKELMERFDVSRITVANALVQLAKDGWIYRIPGRGSFVSEPTLESRTVRQADAAVIPSTDAAVPLRPTRTKKRMIGLIIPTMTDYFAIRLISGISRVLSDRGYYLYIALTHNSIETEKILIQECLANETAGLIIFPSDAETYNEEILALKMANYPFVLIDRYMAGVETNFVCTNGMNGAKLALSHLWELGHRDIAICSDTPLPTITVSDRINGYMEGLKEHGALINPAMILTDFAVNYSELDPKHPLYRFIRNRMATAYITLNARLGVYISTVAKQIGLRAPEDLSIVTFDDPSSGFDEFGTYTHISQSEERMGREAAEILVDLLEEKARPAKYSKIVLEPELVMRSSTGPVPKVK
ncbi:GntR family transcriptional regulator [Gorillibacterium timonense]|uniref:GntR family transcriptional regulator n=1 Tax=Gorillibacterium timonense TaxID=1689269 RepID=UPI00071D3D41|nr:GntR family transcriptional regulator [Gorillibacterium timonense]